MSQMTATARVATHVPVRRSLVADKSRVRVVPAAPTVRWEGPGFGLVILGLLLAGLLLGLVLNTARGEDSFRLADLRTESGMLAEDQARLEHDLEVAGSSQVLAEKAMDQGMVPGPSAGTINLRDGSITVMGEEGKTSLQHKVITSPTSGTQTKRTPADESQTRGEGATKSTTSFIPSAPSAEKGTASEKSDAGSANSQSRSDDSQVQRAPSKKVESKRTDSQGSPSQREGGSSRQSSKDSEKSSSQRSQDAQRSGSGD